MEIPELANEMKTELEIFEIIWRRRTSSDIVGHRRTQRKDSERVKECKRRCEAKWLPVSTRRAQSRSKHLAVEVSVERGTNQRRNLQSLSIWDPLPNRKSQYCSWKREVSEVQFASACHIWTIPATSCNVAMPCPQSASVEKPGQNQRRTYYLDLTWSNKNLLQ